MSVVPYTLTITQIVGFLILARGVITSKFVIYEQLFNPILSDSFGFSVKQTSYFFVLLLPATIGDAFMLYVSTPCCLLILGLFPSSQPRPQATPSFISQLWRNIGTRDKATIVPDLLPQILSLAILPWLRLVSGVSSLLHKFCQKQLLFGGHWLYPLSQYCLHCYSKLQPRLQLCVFILHRLLLQRLRLNSRIIAIVGIFCSVTGMVLMADWQSIPLDPCTNFSLYYHPELPNTPSNISLNPCSFTPSGCQWLQNGTFVHNVSAVENKITVIESFLQMPESIVQTQEVHPVLNVTAYNMAMNVCESLRESQYHCHWIPKSTGTLCEACPAICRGIDHTLNFIQFTIGAFIYRSTISLGRISIMIVISDVISKDYQVH